MLRRRFDLPFENDGSGRFLPWIVALMVYLSALALAGTILLHEGLGHWDQSLKGIVTVEVPADQAAKVEELLQALRGTPGVIEARALDEAATAKLLEPWLGTAIPLNELPVPKLLDVRIDPASAIDFTALGIRLRQVAPGTDIDDHRIWLDRLFAIAFAVEIAAASVLALIGAAMIGTIVFTTRTGLAMHHATVEVLHLIGARDSYVAGQFERHAASVGLKGGIIGLLLAGITLAVLGGSGRVPFLPALPVFPPYGWAALGALPLLAAGTAMLTARVTVLRSLAKLP